MSSSRSWMGWLAAAVLAFAWTASPGAFDHSENIAQAQASADADAPAADAKADAEPAADQKTETAEEPAADTSKSSESAPTADTSEQPTSDDQDSASTDNTPEESSKETPPADDTSDEDSAKEGDEAKSDKKDEEQSYSEIFMKVLIIFAVLGLPMMLGTWLAKQFRMPEITWKINLVLVTVVAGSCIVFYGVANNNITLGPDLKGGIKLVYQYEPKEGYEEDPQFSEKTLADKMIAAIRDRIDPSGVKELGLRTAGDRRIEIVMPDVGEEELLALKRVISQTGALEFRVTANIVDHEELVEKAYKSASRLVKTDDLQGRWVTLGDEDIQHDPRAFNIRQDRTPDSGAEILIVHDAYNVTGEYLSSSKSGVDDSGRPCIFFRFNSTGASKFGGLTGDNLPDQTTGHKSQLAIVLDERLRSAPSINSVINASGQITGNFTQQEVDDIVRVLESGSLPAELHKEPETEQTVGPTLGADMIKKGTTAVTISVLLVLVFMLFYYRFAGIIACFALLINLVLVLAVMISFHAAFTLPGLAGMVLTIGMSVDANVLIFERIREELNRGAALRMAIRNGFARATTTIVDANLTTLITAIVLYVIGTAEIKGFAVILILGILMSMYTAIFCSRIVFNIAERRRWITQLSMLHIIGVTKWDFLSWRKLAGMCSAVLIVAGMVGVVGRGGHLLGIDFTGGSSVTIKFREGQELPTADVRDKIDQLEGFEDASVVAVGEGNRMYNINTRTSGIKTAHVQFKAGISTSAEEITKKVIAAGYDAKKIEVTQKENTPGLYVVAVKSKDFAVFKNDLTTGFKGQLIEDSVDSDLLAVSEYSELEHVQEVLKDLFGDQLQTYSVSYEALKSSDNSTQVTPVSLPAESKTDSEEDSTATISTTTKLTFADGILHDTVKARITRLAKEAGHEEVQITVSHPMYDSDQPLRFKEWDLEIALSPAETKVLLDSLTEHMNSTPVFPSSSNIGGKVAGDTQTQAGMALFLSLLFIVGYLWIRFQRVMFGLAAVVALVHDVMITLGVLALSYYLVEYFSPVAAVLQIDQFKISLPILAAFLTIIGYSLNDTIVVFDRIREVRGKSPTLTAEMINTSLNQTLSRTLLTSATTLIVVLILYFVGGEGIHGFAFALVVGVLVGTYSSIFIASPTLLWMSQAGERSAARRKVAGTAK